MKNFFGANVKKYRKLRGMTQLELANLLGYKNKASIGKIENGNNDLPVSMAEKIANILGADVMDLIHYAPTEDAYSEYIEALKKADASTISAVRKLLDLPPLQEGEKKAEVKIG